MEPPVLNLVCMDISSIYGVVLWTVKHRYLLTIQVEPVIPVR